MLLDRFTDVTSVGVPDEKAFAEQWTADDLLQILGSQVVIEEGAAGPAELKLVLEFVYNLLNRTLVLEQDVWPALESIKSGGQHDSDAQFVVAGCFDGDLFDSLLFNG